MQSLVLLPLRLDELRGEPPLQLVAVEALHVIGLLEQAQRWVRRVQSVGRIETSRAEGTGGEKSRAKQKQGLKTWTVKIKQEFQRQNVTAALSTQVIAHLHSLKPSHMR